MLTDWWTRLEVAPGFGGARRYIQGLFGAGVTAFLEAEGVLRQGRSARTIPCTANRGDGCRREVVEIDGEFHAVCGSRPTKCSDIILSAHDVAQLNLDVNSLCRAIASVLAIRGNPEPVRDISGVHKVGTKQVAPGMRYPIFLIFRLSAQGYAEAIAALVARQGGAPFAALIPTDRFLSDDPGRVAARHGVQVLVLTDILKLDGSGFNSAVAPEMLLSAFGVRNSSGGMLSADIVARALVCNGTSTPVWRDLDEAQYQSLVANADQYDVFADQRQHRVLKSGVSVSRQQIADSWFNTILAAVTSRGHYDPNVKGPDLASGKQIFQRARSNFDIKTGGTSWQIFKSVQHEEGHTVYAFQPHPGVSFAYVFLPED